MKSACLVACLTFASTPVPIGATSSITNESLQKIVDDAILPIFQSRHVPGIALAISINGERHFYNYGVLSSKTKKQVTNETLFELGSVSKTFAALLASLACANGSLNLSDTVSSRLPFLKGSGFDKVSVLNLATHTSGGLTLQVPETTQTETQLDAYLKAWKPTYPPGTYRIYSNPSIGLLGLIAANSFDESYEKAVETEIFAKLAMNHSYLNVPESASDSYAEGHTASGAPTRMTSRVLSPQAYGIRSCALDMIQYLEANMATRPLPGKLQTALNATHQSYFTAGTLTQDLAWEQFSLPVKTKDALSASSDSMVLQPNKVSAVDPTTPQNPNVLIHKTGSTNGFSTYVVFAPSKKIALVFLANKSMPIAPRINAAFKILGAIDDSIIAQ